VWSDVVGISNQFAASPLFCRIVEFVDEGGMWVLFGSYFMFSNFYRVDLHNETCCDDVALASLLKNRSSPD
jgi:hypothetical protein